MKPQTKTKRIREKGKRKTKTMKKGNQNDYDIAVHGKKTKRLQPTEQFLHITAHFQKRFQISTVCCTYTILNEKRQ